MKTRRIQGTDIQTALREVRRTLGPDAVIMSTRETAGGIEITAGVFPAVVTPMTRHTAKPVNKAVTPGALSSLAAGLVRRNDVQAKPPALAQGITPRDELLALGFTAQLCDQVMHDVREESTEEIWDATLGALASRLPIEGNSLLKHGGRMVVVGGTGVGKTTTVVKLAAHFARMHGPESVALINTDNVRVGASEQLRRYARLMGLALCHVRGPADLGLAFERLSDRKLVLVDTAGASYHDLRLMDELSSLQDSGMDLRCYLTASCNSQLAVLERTIRSFAHLAVHGCILTKSDEAVSLGPALSFATRHAMPLSFVTTGTKVPTDIRIARSDWLVERCVELLDEARRMAHTNIARHAPRGAN